MGYLFRKIGLRKFGHNKEIVRKRRKRREREKEKRVKVNGKGKDRKRKQEEEGILEIFLQLSSIGERYDKILR